jgi:PAS domain S-box-containing protein
MSPTDLPGGVEESHLREFYGYIYEATRFAGRYPELLKEEDIRYLIGRFGDEVDGLALVDDDAVPFLAGGGEMASHIGKFDWSNSSLGKIAQWPQSLRTAVSLMLNSQHPMWIGWGSEMTFLYNDAYIGVLSLAKHPWALGRPAREVWAEIWEYCGPLANKVFEKGEASFVDDVRLLMNRGDILEEVYYSFSYSPIRDESGEVGGLFCPSAEITPKVLNARRLATLAELAANALVEKTATAACASAFATLAKNPADVPFALFYMLEPEAGCARLEQMVGNVDAVLRPASINLSSNIATGVWPIAEIARTGKMQVVPVSGIEGLPLGLANQRISQAVALPVTRGEDRPLGVLIGGVNPARRLDAEHQTFFELVAGQLATAIQRARAAEEDKRRADALAEIDRAKTAFFSNVSHELRTPLTLMLGPLEDMLNRSAGMLGPEDRHLADIAYRNGLRLLKLVNTLLDFSRIEAGRIEVTYESTNMPAFTADLASVFRSVIEKAGLSYVVDCPPQDEPAFVDREMWEKIVFNLLSNALKFTFSGEIALRLHTDGSVFKLTVSDTGAGIPESELARIFERFHRVRGAQSRSHEGTGIGLALVRELARLHSGDATVESEEGRGSTFTVTIPCGLDHLPPARISAARKLSSTRSGSAVFVDEASGWIQGAGADEQTAGTATNASASCSGAHQFADGASTVAAAPDSPRILLVDDNADMRNYVCGLLGASGYNVIAVTDGQAALDAVRSQPPDLVLSDVMMPRLDGFELLRTIRNDPRTAVIPIILLSARAGEEARVEGVSKGADDYLTKPFNARELIARVGTHLELARMRKSAAAEVRASEERYRAFVANSSEGIWRLEFDPPIDTTLPVEEQVDCAFRQGKLAECNDAMARMYGLESAEALVGKTLDWMLPPTDLATRTYFALIINSDYRVVDVESIERDAEGRTVYFSNSMVGLVENGMLRRMWGTQRDITERKQVENAILASESFNRSILESSHDCIKVLDRKARLLSMSRNGMQMLGITDITPLLGKSWLDFWEGEDRHAAEAAVEAALAGKVGAFVGLVRFVKEEPKWFDVLLSPIRNENGDVERLLAVSRDVTDRKRAEERLREAKEQAESASRAKDNFLAQLSHELRTPLTPVLMTAGALCEDDSIPGPLRDQLAMIERNVALEARLIDDLLDLTRVTCGKLALRAEPCDLHSLIELAVEIVRDEAREKQIDLSLELKAERRHLIGDPARLQQVIWNLLRNAVKFTPRGGHVHISSSDALDISGADGGCSRIEISDDGIGFDMVNAEHLFEPFRQASEGHGAGLGLGLAIARALVDLHRGHIRASSPGPGRGATFTVELPAAASQSTDAGILISGGNGAGAEDARHDEPMRLLVVEDHEPTLQVLTRLLTRAGHHVTTANSVACAREIAAANRFDLVVSDLGLPDGTGIDLMESLRAAYGLRGIALSGYGMEEDLRRSEEAGFVAHLVKPVNINELRRVLRRMGHPSAVN